MFRAFSLFFSSQFFVVLHRYGTAASCYVFWFGWMCFLGFSFFLPNRLDSQTRRADSLKTALRLAPSVKDSLRLLNCIAFETRFISASATARYGQITMRLADRLGDSRYRAEAWRMLGFSYRARGSFDTAQSYFYTALGLAKQESNLPLQARIFNDLGNLARSHSEFIRARQFFGLALEAYSALANDVDSYEDALQSMVEEQSPNPIEIIKEERADVLMSIGLVNVQQGLIDEALAYYQEAVSLLPPAARTTAQRSQRNLLMSIIGVAHLKRAETLHNPAEAREARQYLTSVLQSHTASGDSIGIATMTEQIGVTYRIEGLLDSAERTLQAALVLRRRTKDGERLLAVTLSLLVELYRSQHKPERALDYAKQALAAAQRAEARQAMLGAEQLLGEVFTDLISTQSQQRSHAQGAQGVQDSALYWIRRSMVSAKALKNTIFETQSLKVLARFWTRVRAYDSAEVAWQAQRTLALSKNLRREEEKALEGLVEHYTLTKNYARALEYSRALMAVRDSIGSSFKSQRIQALQSQLALENSQRRIFMLEAEQVRERNERFVIILALALALLALAGGTVALVYFRRTNSQLKEQQEQLARQNIEILTVNELVHKQNQRLEDLNAQNNEFLAIAAHDLKNPLAGIILHAELLERRGFAKEAAFESHTETNAKSIAQSAIIALTSIRTSAQGMLRLISRLLDMNAIESGVRELYADTFNLPQILASVLRENEAALAQKTLSVVVKVGNNEAGNAAETCLVYADREALRQVLENLVSNAIKFSPKGATVFCTMVCIMPSNANAPATAPATAPANALENTQRITRFVIRDEGAGIRPEDIGRLFGRYQRLSARPTGGEPSTGLGLAIVKRLVEAMNGKIWHEPSESSTGATFVLELPAGKSD
jgi:signal transduction histidine kinase